MQKPLGFALQVADPRVKRGISHQTRRASFEEQPLRLKALLVVNVQVLLTAQVVGRKLRKRLTNLGAMELVPAGYGDDQVTGHVKKASDARDARVLF